MCCIKAYSCVLRFVLQYPITKMSYRRPLLTPIFLAIFQNYFPLVAYSEIYGEL